MQFNNPTGGTPASIGNQLVDLFYQKKALVDIAKEQYFSQLADVTGMPKNMGKQIKRYQYLPMLSDANLNDQGIDAAGAVISSTTYVVTLAGLVQSYATAPLALAAFNAIVAVDAAAGAVQSGAGPFIVTVTKTVLAPTSAALSTTLLAAVPKSVRMQRSGNLYGSSKDVGTIAGKLPALAEAGGRVNRVGFKRKELVGTLAKFGFFDEYTADSLNFDTDADMLQYVNAEMIKGANEMTEDALQIDLLNSAGVVRFAGAATQNSEVNSTSLVTYGDMMRLAITLDNNRTPKSTKVIAGSRMIDTKTINGGRIAYIGSELLPTFKAMKDLHNNPAFISIEKYADAGNTVVGEVGAVDNFRLVVVPEMMKWAGAGALTTDSINYDNGLQYDVFPILVVGDESFTTIGFQTDGKSVKFQITHKAPGVESADRNDPYGETGFMSIKWFYGFMILRPERIALIKTVARL